MVTISILSDTCLLHFSVFSSRIHMWMAFSFCSQCNWWWMENGQRNRADERMMASCAQTSFELWSWDIRLWCGGGGAELWSHLPADCIWIREDGKRIMLQFSYFWNSSMNQFIVSDVKLLFTENLFLKDWSMRMATPKCFLAYVLPKPSTIWPILLIQDNKC